MKLTWYGLACFYIEGNSVRVLMDPFDGTVGYIQPSVNADVWTCSHDHYDHNCRSCITNSDVLDATDGLDSGGVRVTGVKTWHDNEDGAIWGDNTIWVVEQDGLRVAHLGDLGHLLSDEQLRAMGEIDVLLIPTGGYTFTIDEKAAAQVAKQINARLTIPMHYRTHHLVGFDLNEGVEKFLEEFNCRVIHTDENVIEITGEILSEPTIAVLTLA